MAMKTMRSTMVAAMSAHKFGSGGLISKERSRLLSNFSFTPRPPPISAEPSTTLVVSLLSKRTTSEGLREAFAQFSQVIDARILTDSEGVVRYATLEDAAKGIEGMDGKFLDGQVIFADYAKPRPQYNGSPMSF